MAAELLKLGGNKYSGVDFTDYIVHEEDDRSKPFLITGVSQKTLIRDCVETVRNHLLRQLSEGPNYRINLAFSRENKAFWGNLEELTHLQWAREGKFGERLQVTGEGNYDLFVQGGEGGEVVRFGVLNNGQITHNGSSLELHTSVGAIPEVRELLEGARGMLEVTHIGTPGVEFSYKSEDEALATIDSCYRQDLLDSIRSRVDYGRVFAPQIERATLSKDELEILDALTSVGSGTDPREIDRAHGDIEYHYMFREGFGTEGTREILEQLVERDVVRKSLETGAYAVDGALIGLAPFVDHPDQRFLEFKE